MQCRLESSPELIYGFYVICRPFSFNSQVLELCDEVFQFVPLHFYFKELLMSVHLFVSVSECASDVTASGLMQDLNFSVHVPLSHLRYRPTPPRHVPLHQVIPVVTWCVTLPARSFSRTGGVM